MNVLNENIERECCPVFHPEKWDNKTFHWDHKPFILSSVPTLFHIPYPPMIGNRITKMMEKAEDSRKLAMNKEDILLLFTDPNPFKSEIYLSVAGEVPNAKNTSITGTFKSKVFDGRYNQTPKFMKQMKFDLNTQGFQINNFYVHYAYCPRCSKEMGHNYMILIAEICNEHSEELIYDNSFKLETYSFV